MNSVQHTHSQSFRSTLTLRVVLGLVPGIFTLVGCSLDDSDSPANSIAPPRVVTRALSADGGDAGPTDAGLADAGDAGPVFMGNPFIINSFNSHADWVAPQTTPDHNALLTTGVPINPNLEANEDLYVALDESYRISMSIKGPGEVHSLDGLRFIELEMAGGTDTENMVSIGLSTSSTLGEGFYTYVPLTGYVSFSDPDTYETIDIPLSDFAPLPDGGGGADAGIVDLDAVKQVEVRFEPTGPARVWRIDDIRATYVPVGECRTAADCSDDNLCTTDNCVVGANGGACTHTNMAADTVCRPAAGECDVEEVCPGGGDPCPTDDFVAADEACGSDNETECDMADSCDGAGTCSQNHVATGTACTDGTCSATGTCTPTPPPPPAAGAGGGGGAPAGGAPAAAGAAPVAGAGGAGGVGGTSGAAGAAGAAPIAAAGDDGGCGCSIPGKSEGSMPISSTLGASLLGLLLARRRRSGHA
jgi:hypothetical protein